jgi:peptidoglycan/LPS O-acetylase OafA/YrhL
MRQPLGYVPALDGLRGIAIAGVIGRHYFGWPNGGGIGVDLFFVLSGYLITTLLLDEHAADGRISLRGFYGRRVRRLAPALAAMLAIYLAISAAKGQLGVAARAVAWFGFYTGNIASAYLHVDAGALGPLWSLAEEEQFYLLWPIALIVLLRFRVPQRWIVRLLLAAIVAVSVERIVLAATGASYERMAYSPEARCDAILAGALVAVLLRRVRRLEPELVTIGIVALAGLAVVGPLIYWGGPLLDLCGGIVVAGVILWPASLPSRVFSFAPLVGLGRISYSLYLWHMPVLLWAGWSHRYAAVAISVAVAYLSWRWIEQPFRRRRLVVSSASPAPAV